MTKSETTINGKVYAIIQPPVTQALPLCTKASVLLGPVISMMGAEQIELDGLTDNAKLLRIFGTVIQHVNAESLDELLMRAVDLSHLCCDGHQISNKFEFEKHFANHKGEVFQVMGWCLWECVKDFFPMLTGFLQAMPSAVENQSPSPKDGI